MYREPWSPWLRQLCLVPFDGIPDFLFGWGLVDDATISYAGVPSELELLSRQEAQEPWQEADGQDADKDKRPADIPEDDDS